MSVEARLPRREEGESEGGAKGRREKEENNGGRKFSEPFSCVHVRVRIPTAMLFFCCHKCHTEKKEW